MLSAIFLEQTARNSPIRLLNRKSVAVPCTGRKAYAYDRPLQTKHRRAARTEVGVVSAGSDTQSSQGKSFGVEGTNSSVGSEEAGMEVMPRGVMVPTLTGTLPIGSATAERMSMEPIVTVVLRRDCGADCTVRPEGTADSGTDAGDVADVEDALEWSINRQLSTIRWSSQCT